jgi:phosphoglycerol transferase MdoB-like AlkP superfamily enzyme
MTLSKNRFGTLYLLAAVFVVLSFVVRTALFMRALPGVDLSPLLLLKIYGVGFFFDCVTLTYFALPFALCLVLAPATINRFHRFLVHGVFIFVLCLLLFDAVAEYLFFDEFGTRFNFIAIDYLIYTREVVGNIRQSYPLNWILSGILLLGIVIYLFLRKQIDQALVFAPQSPARKALYVAVLALLPVAAFVFVDQSMTSISQNSYANELAGNGIYDLFAAFRNSELDFQKFYPVKDERVALARLRELVKEKNNRLATGDIRDITRVISNAGPEKRLNVVVIVEESLSAEYLGAFGNTGGLTPNLDTLARKSLLFTHLYATGTRTVRGLEAIALSLPPLPGTSIIKRPNNENFFSWGSLMRAKGYDTKFIYGGHGYFDNMNYFFSHNGFAIVDRSDFSRDEVAFANAWGVCDVDLFRKVILEAGKSHASGKPFFSLVMTTSNHRPFTYPAGAIDIPSGSGRGGGVKYSDYAIGKFIEEARKQPWFDKTLIVILADHCAGSAGKTELPVKRYEIPMLIYAPAYVKPGRIDTLASQIDVAPTVLGLLNFSYETKFFGKDILKTDPAGGQAFISTYQKLGFIRDDQLVVIGPQKYLACYLFDRKDGNSRLAKLQDGVVDDMLSYYQGASYVYKNGLNRIGPTAH